MSEPLDVEALAAEAAALRAERDRLHRRAVEAETLAEQLADALADARRRLAETPVPDDAAAGPDLPFFGGTDGTGGAGSTDDTGDPDLSPGGDDRAVLPLALAAVALVTFLLAALTVAVGTVSLVTVVAGAVGLGLAWAAYLTRAVRRSVKVVDGVVEVVEGDSTRRFDLRNDSVRIEVQGRPGDAYWRVRFHRRALDPVDVDDSMVEPAEFMRRLRELRPGL